MFKHSIEVETFSDRPAWFGKNQWRVCPKGSWVFGSLLLALLLPMRAMQAQEQPAPSVSVARVTVNEVQEQRQYPGRLTAIESVALKPRVSGQIKQIYFQQGSEVRVGDLLLEIDPRPFQALFEQASAEAARAQVAFDQAQREAKRGQSLLNRKALSEEAFEARTAAEQSAKAQLKAAQAQLALRQLELDFTQVKAPITGRVGVAEVTAGNWVQAGQTLLTHLVSTAKLYADFAVDEGTFVQYGDNWKLGSTGVGLDLLEQQGQGYQATLSFMDNQVDPGTGTIAMRATVDNAEGKLRPGFFVQVHLPTRPPYPGILIEESAIAADQNTRYVFTVDEKNTVGYRPIELGPKMKALRVVRSGLVAGDRIITNGLMRVRPGMTVSPQEVAMGGDAQPGGAAAH